MCARVQGPKRLLSERLKPYTARGQPHACSLCRDRIHEKIGFEARSVVHADLIPTAVGLQLFRAMPASVKGQVIVAALTGKGAFPSNSCFLCCSLMGACTFFNKTQDGGWP